MITKKNCERCDWSWIRAQLESDAPPNMHVCNYVRPLSFLLQAYTKGQVQDSQYFYIKNLLAQQEVCSPLVISAWTEELLSHPDKFFGDFMLQGIQRVGFDRWNHNLFDKQWQSTLVRKYYWAESGQSQ